MTPLTVDFSNLHQILKNLYENMMPLCSSMTGIAKGVAGLGALFFIASKVWGHLSRAEPIDVYPLLRPFAIGLCIMFFPTFVLGTINTVLSPVVKGTNQMLQGQTLDLYKLQEKKNQLEHAAKVREGKEWIVNSEVFDQRLSELGIFDAPEIMGMYAERSWYDFKQWFRKLFREFLELLFQGAALVIDTIRTFYLIVLAILGPLVFGLSCFNGFESSLITWLTRYVQVYLWLPVSDLFSSVLARIETLILDSDISKLNDADFIPDTSDAIYIIFMLIGIVGYFTVPTVASWIVSAGSMGSMNQAIQKGGAMAGAIGGAVAGKMITRQNSSGGSTGNQGGDKQQNDNGNNGAVNGKLM